MNKPLTGIDSAVIFRNSQGAECRGALVHITRTTIVFEVYNPYSIVQASEVLGDLTVLRGDRIVYKGRAVVSMIVPTGLMHIVSASLLDLWSDLVAPTPGEGLRQEVRNFVQEWEESHHLGIDYRLAVGNIRNFLAELSRWCGQFEAAVGVDQLDQRPSLQREFCEEIEVPLIPKLDELGYAFEKAGQGVAPEQDAVHKSYARRELHPLILRSPFCHRCYTKPLGYAGDYEMVNMIVRDRWEGPNTYAKLVNSILLRSNGAQAHRNRIAILQRCLAAEARRVAAEKRPLRVLNVGCGPAAELQQFIRENPDSNLCRFELMDFNEETLAYARRRLEEACSRSGNRVEMEFVHRSIHDLLKMTGGRNAPIEAVYDFVYCAGLFDYLNDSVCRRLLRLFAAWTRPGGLALATNVHTSNPVRVFIEHLLDWYLVLRDNASFGALAPDGVEKRIDTDATGVNIFLYLRKPVHG